jgi:hypothetical protein
MTRAAQDAGTTFVADAFVRCLSLSFEFGEQGEQTAFMDLRPRSRQEVIRRSRFLHPASSDPPSLSTSTTARDVADDRVISVVLPTLSLAGHRVQPADQPCEVQDPFRARPDVGPIVVQQAASLSWAELLVLSNWSKWSRYIH